MKKLLFFLTITSLLLFIRCGDDDSETPQAGVNGTLTFGGQSYTIASGILVKKLTSVGADYEFFLGDGSISATGSGGVSSGDSQILVAARAIAEGSTTLEAGTYEVSRQVNSQYAFVSVTAAGSSSVQSIVGGTIEISGSENTYSLTFNAFGGGIALTGSVNGTFEE